MNAEKKYYDLDQVFADVDVSAVPCCYEGSGCPCVCLHGERVLRAISNEGIEYKMTAKQRDWCVSEIVHCCEDHEPENVYRSMSDVSLANAVLLAMADYCRDKGLL